MDEVLVERPLRSKTRSIREILGLRRSHPKQGEIDLKRALLPIGNLAGELCAQRGFDIKLQGVLPTEGAILSVESLNFDKAIVLLSLIPNTRVYSETSFAGTTAQIRALSLRVFSNLAHSAGLGSMVRDLANQRVVIADAPACARLQRSRALLMPVYRVCLGRDDGGEITVEVQAPDSGPHS